MLQAPIRLLLALRTSTAPGVLLATAVSTLVFSATPFLVRAIAVDRDLEVGVVGVISTTQLAGFTVAAWGAGRLVRPRRAVLVVALLLGIVSNLGSGFAPGFGALAAIRAVSGLSLGLIAWISWAEAFGDDDKVGDVAVVGPLVGSVGAPVIAAVVDGAGPDALFVLLAALHLVPLVFVHRVRLTAKARPRHERHRPTRAALAILVSLGLVTFGGSAVFVFAAAVGQDEIGMSAFVVSLVFAANALAGVPSARFRGRRRLPGLWFAVIASAAVVLTTVQHPVAFWIVLPAWGFAFWMAIPGAFVLLAARSRYPDERAGDAQAVMAAGRVFGPLVGGAVYAWSVPWLGIVGGVVLGMAALAMLLIELRIHPEALGDLLR